MIPRGGMTILSREPVPSPMNCHPDRSVAQWRDLRFLLPRLCCGPQPPFPLSSRPERSVVERSAVSIAQGLLRATSAFPLSSRPERSALERSAVSIAQGLLRATSAFPLSSRPERSAVERSAVSIAQGLLRATSAFPLSSRPERSAVERSAVSVAQDSAAGHKRPSLCHLDRSAAQWRDLGRSALEVFSSRPQPRFQSVSGRL
jgi:hypothetical protein